MGFRIDLVTGVPRGVVVWWRAWRRQTRNEASRGEPQVDPSLAKAVLARADPALAKAEVRSSMARVMRHFAIDPGSIPPRFWGRLRSAEDICSHCFTVGRCQHWAHGHSNTDEPRQFCPNAKLYEEIAASMEKPRDPDAPPAT